MTWLLDWVRSYFCSHSWGPWHGVYGDARLYMRCVAVRQCVRCRKVEKR